MIRGTFQKIQTQKQNAPRETMTIEQILIAGFGLLITVVAFFLSKFYNQVERVVNDVQEIKLKQVENSQKITAFEEQLDIFKQLFLKNNFTNDFAKHH